MERGVLAINYRESEDVVTSSFENEKGFLLGEIEISKALNYFIRCYLIKVEEDIQLNSKLIVDRETGETIDVDIDTVRMNVFYLRCIEIVHGKKNRVLNAMCGLTSEAARKAYGFVCKYRPFLNDIEGILEDNDIPNTADFDNIYKKAVRSYIRSNYPRELELLSYQKNTLTVKGSIVR
jgi:hypothetical protein